MEQEPSPSRCRLGDGTEWVSCPTSSGINLLSCYSVTYLEFHWGPNRDLQDVYQKKRTVLLQRSSRRLDQVEAKGRGRSSAPVTCKGPRLEDPKPKPGASEQRHPEKPGSAKQRTVLQPPPGSTQAPAPLHQHLRVLVNQSSFHFRE